MNRSRDRTRNGTSGSTGDRTRDRTRGYNKGKEPEIEPWMMSWIEPGIEPDRSRNTAKYFAVYKNPSMNIEKEDGPPRSVLLIGETWPKGTFSERLPLQIKLSSLCRYSLYNRHLSYTL